MSHSTQVVIGLSAVVIAAGSRGLDVLLSPTSDGLGLPFGSFDPEGHRTFELAVRDFVTAQTGFALGYVEQLYTFGDKGREAPLADMGQGAKGSRVVSVGYLALAPDLKSGDTRAGDWVDWYSFFPWEDRRQSSGDKALASILAPLSTWARAPALKDRVVLAFGLNDSPWHEERVLDRYELLYEAGLVPEARRDQARAQGRTFDSAGWTGPPSGLALASDHRRILATAMGRLRAKIKYRPVIFDLAPDTFTLSELQDLVEGLSGVRLHKQNFRRTLERSGLVEPTGAVKEDTGGRPAKLFAKSAISRTAGAPGLSLPLVRVSFPWKRDAH
jgi:hypothetical protein